MGHIGTVARMLLTYLLG